MTYYVVYRFTRLGAIFYAESDTERPLWTKERQAARKFGTCESAYEMAMHCTDLYGEKCHVMEVAEK